MLSQGESPLDIQTLSVRARRLRPSDTTAMLFMVFVIALVLRVLFISSTTITPLSDAERYLGQANHLLSGQGLVTEKGVPTAYTPPGYPVFLAGIEASLGQRAIPYVQAVLGALSCALTFLIGYRLCNRRTAVLAGLLLAVSPTSIVYTGVLLSEVLTTLLMVGALFLLIEAGRLARDRRQLLFFYGAVGLLFGLAILIRPAVLAYSFGITLCLLFFQPGSFSQRILTTAALGFGILVVITPWTYRNYTQLHALVPIATNGGYNLLLGNNPQAYGGGWMPLEEASELRRDNNEVVGGRKARDRALEWIIDNPLDYAKVSARRALDWVSIVPDYVSSTRLTSTAAIDATLVHHFRQTTATGSAPPDTPALQKSKRFNWVVLAIWFCITIPLALAGIVIDAARRPTWLLLFPLATYAGVLCLAFMQIRFREIMMPILLIYTAVGVTGLPRIRETWRHAFPWGRGVLLLGFPLGLIFIGQLLTDLNAI